MKHLAVLLLALGLTGCAGLSELESINSLGTNEIVLTGRIELDPPLRQEEQELHALGSGRYRNKLMLVVGEDYINLNEPGFDALRNSAAVTLGEDFHIRVARHDQLILSGGIILMGADSRGRTDYMRLPGKARFNVNTDDEAIYIGTIVFHRDHYNGITGIDVIDEHHIAQRTFRNTFGGTLRSRKASLENLQD